MAAVVATTTQPGAGTVSRIRGRAEGNVKVRYYNLALDTGDYAQTGITITGQSLNPPLDSIYFVTGSGGVITNGTDKVTANGYGITYASDNSSFTIFLYESAADGDLFDNKPAEAIAANCFLRLKIEGN
jgi:hypothetical protein